MLTRTFDHALNRTLTLMRELFLILAVGILGSQLLILLNGGPIGADVQASTQTMGPIRVSSFDIDLDPGNPAVVRSVYVHLVEGHAAGYSAIRLTATEENWKAYRCQIHTETAWHCPTPGLRLVDMELLVVSGS